MNRIIVGGIGIGAVVLAAALPFLSRAPLSNGALPAGMGTALVQGGELGTGLDSAAPGLNGFPGQGGDTDPIRQYLHQNPEVIVEALQIYERRQIAQAERQRTELFAQLSGDLVQGDGVFLLGPEDADVLVVEFFDYQCPFCRQGFEHLMQVVEADPKVRVAFVEFPVLGPVSDLAAAASLAAIEQDLYMAFHTGLMRADGQLSEATVFQIAEEVGLDLERLRADMGSQKIGEALAANHRIAEMLSIRGTPSFFVGDQFLGGFVEADVLRARIAEERAEASRS